MAEILREGTNFGKIIRNKRGQTLTGGTHLGKNQIKTAEIYPRVTIFGKNNSNRVDKLQHRGQTSV
jgi:hypothetical protein